MSTGIINAAQDRNIKTKGASRNLTLQFLKMRTRAQSGTDTQLGGGGAIMDSETRAR